MKIDSSSIGMESARSYSATQISFRRFATTDFADVLTGSQPEADTNTMQPNEEENKRAISPDSIMDLQQKMAAVRRNFTARSSEMNQQETIRQQTIQYIFDLLFGDLKQRFHDWIKSNTTPCIGQDTGIGTIDMDAAQQLQKPVRIVNYQAVDVMQESENTSFSTTGIVKTQDGREINFNIDVSMSREFREEFAQDLGISYVQTCDPLVISLDGNVCNVSDQHIFFDIDADGELDEVNKLAAGSGYLALDKNGDGIINDGSELFGTSSGNGFKDLATYDEDGNGWIDENDAIWSKLKIWASDENGGDKLYTLAEAGVGALCLQNVSTNFTHTDENNNAKAFIRNSGVFLYENGNAGLLQHLDLVKYAKEA